MKIKISQTWSKIVKTWSTAYDFLAGGQALTNFYRWLSRRIYGQETRVIKTRGGDKLICGCGDCPFFYHVSYSNMPKCADRDDFTTHNKNIDPACELHFRTPVLFQILPVVLAYIGTLAIILTACLLYWKYR